MHRNIVIIFLFCFVLFPFPSLAQISDIEFEKSIKHESLVIENEDLKISYVGQKAEFIEVVYDKIATYKILDNSKSLFTVELPEIIDPTYVPFGSSIKNLNRLLDDIRITRFETEILKPDGNVLKPEISREEIKHRIINDQDRFGKIYSYRYSIDNVDSGDVVTISYAYSIQYLYNYLKLFSDRMFLHSKHPRKRFKLTISHHFDLEVDTFFMNNSNPVKEIVDNHFVYSWDLTNLPGCLDEVGSRPHNELPWFTITMKPYELLYMDFNSFRETFVPMWYYTSYAREERLRSAVVDEQIGVKNKDNLSFDKLANRFKKMGVEDTTGIVRLRYFQRFMVDSVTYYDDFPYYNNDENFLKDHPGRQLKGYTVKDHMKEFVYASMIPKMDLYHFTAYAADKRSGTMGQEYYAPVYDNEFLFAAILNNNSVAFVMPKSEKRNLYCEELPFYYEGVPVILIYTYDFAGYKRNFNEVVRLIDTPGSTFSDNCRKTNCMGTVNSDDNSIEFSAKVSLSGQYSTLTRSIYTKQAGDSSINPRYLQKLWENGHEVEELNYMLNETSIYFPYKTSMDAKYKLKNVVEKKGNLVSVDISNWTRHILHENFTSEARETSFYPDFLGSDSYAFMLQFDQPITLVSPTKEISIENDFGTFTFSVKNPGPNQILINSYFLTKQEMVENKNVHIVESLYKAIESSENLKLELQLNSKQ